MARSFDFATGPNYAVTSVGSVGAVGNGAYTIIGLFNISATSFNNDFGIISFRSTGINAELQVVSNQLFGANDFVGGQTGVTTGTWWWAAIRKASGSAVYRFSLRQYNTGSTTHQDTAASHADSGVSNTSVRLGDADVKGNGLIAVWAAWTSNLSDSAVAGMFTTAATDITAQSPAALWLGNQASGSDPINDQIGTANQTSVNGAVGVGSDPPSYNYSLSSSAPTFIAPSPYRRRTQPPVWRARASAPVRAQVNPPFPFTGVKQPRRLRGLSPRRARSSTPVPPQFNPPFPISVMGQVRRLRGLLPRRGRAVGPVPAQVIVTPPAYPPAAVRTRLRGLRLFRPRAATPVPAQVVLAAPVWTPVFVRARHWAARMRRASVAVIAPSQAIPTPQPRLRGHTVAPRRGHAAAPIPPQIVIVPPAYPGRSVRARLKGLKIFRGRPAMPVLPQEVNPPSPPPVTTPIATGSWWNLKGALDSQRQIDEFYAKNPTACPNDGEPLRYSRDGLLYCPYDNWMPPGQTVPAVRGLDGNWGGMEGVLAGARTDASEDLARLTIACPNDGEPLSVARDGTVFCPFDGWQPPNQAKGG